MDDICILWKKYGDGACIYAVYGYNGVVSIPDNIDNLPVRKIGDYCFSQSDRIPDDCEMYGIMSAQMRRICGEYLGEVTLPDEVGVLGNFAFYNCRNLKYINISEKLREVGSDVFMNCMKFHDITIRCTPDSETGLKQILGRISWDVNVKFEKGGETYASVFYPEYFENYDEIAPAHIFGRNIDGEGFRARQAFDNGRINMQQYDSVFDKACGEESERVLVKMSLERLIYPYELADIYRESYISYIKNNDERCVSIVVKDRWLEALEIMCREKLMSAKALNTARAMSADKGWSEGAACLVRIGSNEKNVRKRYEL